MKKEFYLQLFVYACLWGAHSVSILKRPAAILLVMKRQIIRNNSCYNQLDSYDTTPIVVPETLDGYTVTVIGEYAPAGYSNVPGVNLPASLTSIEAYAFVVSDSISTVYFMGTQEQWDDIYIKEGNDILDNVEVICLQE